jgi:hypothetical protein
MTYVVRGALILSAMFSVAITALALPPLPDYLEEHYAKSPEHAKYLSMYRGLETEQKCDACHQPGVDRKTKGHGLNDYGQAVHKFFKHRDFNKADKLGKDNAEEKAKARQLISDALHQADQQKNADGAVYGDLIKAGRLPGKN